MERPGQLILQSGVSEELFIDVCQRPIIEACGVLLGTIDERGDWLIERTLPLRNTFDSPVYFEFDAEELLNIELQYSGQIMGVYHSHPTGFARASETDAQNMHRVNQAQQIPWVWLIIKGSFNAAFVQESQGAVAKTRMIAYHHFSTGGLQEIEIHVRD